MILEPRVTAIIGKNESGKSNVLDGLSRIRFRVRNPAAFNQDTPIINALGMNLQVTFGPANGKINIVTEGMSDYIYLCTMAKQLGINTDKYAIIPSVGASNCVNICSILHGWGCKYIALFDCDQEGVEAAEEHMHKKMYLEYMLI